LVYGGAGNDTLRGGYGDDELHGDDGNDVIFGGVIGSTTPDGYDKLFGGAGDDTFRIDQFDFDLVDGGDGVDILQIAMQRNGHFVIDATNTDPTLGGIIRNVEGLDISENLPGVTFGSYDVTGTDYADRFVAQWANRGQMTFHGRGGDDVAVGGGGDDLLDGGSGSDTITGGYGADTFQVQSWLTSEHDVITDFWRGDRLSFTANDQSVINDFDGFLAHATQTDAGVLVELADDPNYGGNILLNGTTLADFDPSNVVFT
jgi:Ca2+-binding RTX toxin-like protein